MNSLRNKLIASVVMLAVAAVMLTSASFAWYTVSQTGEIQQVKAELKTTENLEIARMDTTESTPSEVNTGQADEPDPDIYWGSTVSRWGNVQPLDYVAKATAEGIKTASISEEDGRLGQLVLAPQTGNINTGVDYCVFDGRTVAVVYNAWLRTNVDKPITVSVSGQDEATLGLYVNGTQITGTEFELDDVGGAVNTAMPVKVTLFFDGDAFNAEDVATGTNGIAISDTGITITFSNEEE